MSRPIFWGESKPEQKFCDFHNGYIVDDGWNKDKVISSDWDVSICIDIGFEILIECQTNTSCLVSCLLVTYPDGPNYWKMTCDNLCVGWHKNVELKGVTKISYGMLTATIKSSIWHLRHYSASALTNTWNVVVSPSISHDTHLKWYVQCATPHINCHMSSSNNLDHLDRLPISMKQGRRYWSDIL